MFAWRKIGHPHKIRNLQCYSVLVQKSIKFLHIYSLQYIVRNKYDCRQYRWGNNALYWQCNFSYIFIKFWLQWRLLIDCWDAWQFKKSILTFVFICRDENASILYQNAWVSGVFIFSKYWHNGYRWAQMKQISFRVIYWRKTQIACNTQ